MLSSLYVTHQDLHLPTLSFPTRRSSVLFGTDVVVAAQHERPFLVQQMARPLDQPVHPRSEEHTTELQSLMRIEYAASRLKKKKMTISIIQPSPNKGPIYTQIND